MTFDDSIEVYLDRLVPAAPALSEPTRGDYSLIRLRDVIESPTMTIHGLPTPVPRRAATPRRPTPPPSTEPKLTPAAVQSHLDELLDIADLGELDEEDVPTVRSPFRAPWAPGHGPWARIRRPLGYAALGAAWLAHVAALAAIALS